MNKTDKRGFIKVMYFNKAYQEKPKGPSELALIQRSLKQYPPFLEYHSRKKQPENRTSGLCNLLRPPSLIIHSALSLI